MNSSVHSATHTQAAPERPGGDAPAAHPLPWRDRLPLELARAGQLRLNIVGGKIKYRTLAEELRVCELASAFTAAGRFVNGLVECAGMPPGATLALLCDASGVDIRGMAGNMRALEALADAYGFDARLIDIMADLRRKAAQ